MLRGIPYIIVFLIFGFVLEGIPTVAFGADCVAASRDVGEGVSLSDGSSQEEQLYRSAIKKCPSLAEAYFNLGILAARKQDWPGAVRWYEKALEKRKDPEFLVALGSAHLEAGDLSKARESYLDAQKEAPNSIKALQGLAAVAKKEGNEEEAYSFLLKAHERNSSNSQILVNMGIVEERMGKNEEALLNYERAITREPSHGEAHLYRAQLLVRMERYRESVPALLSAAELLPENVEVFRTLGVVRTHLNDLEKAEIALRKAVALDSADQKTRVDLAEVLLEKKQPSLAVEVLDDATQKGVETSARYHFVLGEAYLALGELSKSIESFEQCIERDDQYSRGHEMLANLYRRIGKGELAEKHEQAAIAE